MFCPECGKEDHANVAYCGQCGARLTDFVPDIQPEVELDADPVIRPHATETSSKYKPYLAMAAVAIAVLVAVGAFVTTRSSGNEAAPGNPNTVEQEKTRDETTAKTGTTSTSPIQPRTTATNTSTTTMPVITTPSVSHPTEQDIKNDLLGEKLYSSGSGSGLRFEALREFQQFDIDDETENEDVLEYDITMRIRDYATDAQYDVDVLVVYKLEQGQYQFVSVTGTYDKI